MKGNYLAFDSTSISVGWKRITSRLQWQVCLIRTRGLKWSGVLSKYQFPQTLSQKEIRYFWGYRNLVLSDALSKLPIVKETRPANIIDSQVIIPQLRWSKELLGFDIGAVVADSALDPMRILSFIIQDLKAKPYIAVNLRREKNFLVLKSGNRICLTSFKITIPSCPWMHPQLVKGTGYFAYR